MYPDVDFSDGNVCVCVASSINAKMKFLSNKNYANLSGSTQTAHIYVPVELYNFALGPSISLKFISYFAVNGRVNDRQLENGA